jgi:hypothetical protein
MTATVDQTTTETDQAPAPPTVVTVYDCATVAWDEYGAVCLGEFGDLHRDEFNDAGRELIRQPLIAAWRKRGYKVKLIERNDFYAMPEDADGPSNETCWAVWQEAADAVDSDALLAFTDLTHEYTARYAD